MFRMYSLLLYLVLLQDVNSKGHCYQGTRKQRGRLHTECELRTWRVKCKGEGKRHDDLSAQSSLAPRSVTAESSVALCMRITRYWLGPWAVCRLWSCELLFTSIICEVVALLLLHGSVRWVSHERRDCSVYCYGCCVMHRIWFWLLFAQERGCVVLGYATAAVILSQERINMSVVPVLPQVSLPAS